MIKDTVNQFSVFYIHRKVSYGQFSDHILTYVKLNFKITLLLLIFFWFLFNWPIFLDYYSR